MQGKLVALAALVLFTAAVFLAVRSTRVLVALVVSLIVSLVWSNAFAAAAIGHLNQVSAAFNVLIIGLGGELGIHFCMRYAELAAQGRSRTDALSARRASRWARRCSRVPSPRRSASWCSGPPTTAGVAELGLIAGAGVLISLASSLTLLPALLALGANTHPYFAPPSLPLAAKLRHIPVTYSRPIRWAALAIAVGSLALLPRARFDHNPVNLRDPNTESVQAFQDLLEQSSTSPWTVDLIEAGSRRGAGEGRRARSSCPFVESALTLVDYVPQQQDEKRAILETMAFLVPPPVRAERAARRRRADRGARASRDGRSVRAPARPTTRASPRARTSLRDALAKLLAALARAPESRHAPGSAPGQRRRFAGRAARASSSRRCRPTS